MMIARAILAFLVAVAWSPAFALADKADAVLQMDRLLTIHIRMSADRWQMMQPERASRLATALAIVQHPTTQQAIEAVTEEEEDEPDAAEGQRRAPGLVGNQYAYVKGQVEIDGEKLGDVGVRFKGQWSYQLAGSSPRRPLKLKFDEFVDGQEYQGIESMSLNSNAVDPSFLRETLGFAFFRDAGIPAPRTCLALVYLTVDGVYDNELLGLYTVLEEIDKDFLENHFGTTKGLLIRPERTRNLAHFGDEWEEYSRYNLQSDATPFTAGRFMGFTRLIHVADEEVFFTELGSYVDAREFARFLAANVLMVNLDGVLSNGHNFYLYIHPKTGRIAFIPWDLHFSFGPTWGQSLEEQAALTIGRPYRDSNRLVHRALALGWFRDEYRRHLEEMAAGCFAPARMHERIEQLERVVRKAEELAKAEGKELPPTLQTSPPRFRSELKPFVTERVRNVMEQLAGRIEGIPVGGPPPPPRPRPVISPPAPRPVVKEAPKSTTAPVVKVTKPRPTPPPPPPKPRPLPPNPLTSVLVSNLDCDRDGQLSREEVMDGAKHFYMARGWLHRGKLGEASLAATFEHIGRLLDPFPPSFVELDEDSTEPRTSLTWGKAIMQQADATGKGWVDLPELLAAAERMFATADGNGDGKLSAAEIGGQLDRMVPRE